MMNLDKGTKHNDVESQVAQTRKYRLLLGSMMILIPAILLIIYWANMLPNNDWRPVAFVVSLSCIISGCNLVILFETILTKSKIMHFASFLSLFFGGILYIIGAISIIKLYANHHVFDSSNDINFNNSDNIIDYKDGIYWFGIHCLIGMNSIVLAIDCISHLYNNHVIRLIGWTFPLLWTSWFAFGYWLAMPKSVWWEKVGIAGFATIAINMLILSFISCSKRLIGLIGIGLCVTAFLASILVWIFFATIIKKYVNNGHDACLFIAIPFLISSQTLFLLHICLLDASRKCTSDINTNEHYRQEYEA